MRTAPFFLDAFPKGRRPDYPRQRGDLTTDVVIVGGGLTGCACAVSFATAGVRVALIEADRVGGGATAASAGLLRQDFDGSFQETAGRHGLRTARHLWQSVRRASLDFAAAIRRLGIRCDLAPQDLILFTREGADAARRLKREYQARRDAGLDVSWLTAARSHGDRSRRQRRIRTKGDVLDPYRACVGLAAAAAARGALSTSARRSRRIRAGRKSVEIKTDGGRAHGGCRGHRHRRPDRRFACACGGTLSRARHTWS